MLDSYPLCFWGAQRSSPAVNLDLTILNYYSLCFWGAQRLSPAVNLDLTIVDSYPLCFWGAQRSSPAVDSDLSFHVFHHIVVLLSQYLQSKPGNNTNRTYASKQWHVNLLNYGWSLGATKVLTLSELKFSVRTLFSSVNFLLSVSKVFTFVAASIPCLAATPRADNSAVTFLNSFSFSSLSYLMNR